MSGSHHDEAVSQDEGHYIRIGWWVIGVGFLGFMLWAAFAPLDKGVPVSGTVIVSGHRKTVQSPIAGVIQTIEVKEGSDVAAGQLLIQLSDVQAQAELSSLQEKHWLLLATESRLQAEERGFPEIVFSPRLEERDEPRVVAILSLQRQLFLSRRQALNSELDGYQHQVEGLGFEIAGLERSLISKQQQLAARYEQMINLRRLAAEGYFPRNRYLDIQNQHAETRSGIDEISGRIGRLRQQSKEIKARIVQRQAEYQREVSTQRVQTQSDIALLVSQLAIAERDRHYTQVMAPVAGSIVGLRVFTEGAVVRPGEMLMEIVPDQQHLIVDARLAVNLVDKVYPGMPVELMFTALNQNTTPRISGTVTLVSADRLTDRESGESYYNIQVSVMPESLTRLGKNRIKPGMAVELFIKTGERSLLNYLFKPLSDRIHLSLSEE